MIVWTPVAIEEIVTLATPLLSRFDEPTVRPSSSNSTLPAGVPALGLTAATVAVIVTGRLLSATAGTETRTFVAFVLIVSFKVWLLAT